MPKTFAAPGVFAEADGTPVGQSATLNFTSGTVVIDPSGSGDILIDPLGTPLGTAIFIEKYPPIGGSGIFANGGVDVGVQPGKGDLLLASDTTVADSNVILAPGGLGGGNGVVYMYFASTGAQSIIFKEASATRMQIGPFGTQANLDLNLTSKGTGQVLVNGTPISGGGVTWPLTNTADEGFQPNSIATNTLNLHNNASAVNGVQITGTATGVKPILSAVGGDTNIGIVITPKGTGGTAISAGGLTVVGNVVGPLIDGGGTEYNPLAFGAVGNGSTNDTAAINAILASNRTIRLPSGYSFSVTQLAATGLSNIGFIGGGSIVGSDNTQTIMLLTSCTGVTLRDFHISHAVPGVRGTAYGINLVSCTGYDVGNVEIFSTNSAAFISQDGLNGRVHNNYIHDTGADGIHHTQDPAGELGSHHITVDGNVLSNTGDDAIAVVSYSARLVVNSDITISGNTIYQSHTRGITVVGGQTVTIGNNTVDTTKAAGIYIAVEANTLGVLGVNVTGNLVARANTFAPAAGFPSIMVSGVSATNTVANVHVVGNEVVLPQDYGIRALSTVAGGVLDCEIDGNLVVGPSVTSTRDGIQAALVDWVRVVNNTVLYASANGINIGSGCATGVVHTNTIRFPNQGNNAATYGILNASVAGYTGGDNIVVVDVGRTVADAVTNATATVTSATALFSARDVGQAVTGTNIPAATFVGIINSVTSIGLSSSASANVPVNATGSGAGGSLTIAGRTALTASVSTTNPVSVGTFGVIAGAGAIEIQPSNIAIDVLKLLTNVSGINGFEMLGTVTGAGPQLQTISGTDTNVGFNIVPKGTGNLILAGSGNFTNNANGQMIWKNDFVLQTTNVLITSFQVTSPASSVNGIKITAAVTGSGPIIAAIGSDATVDLNLNPKSTGRVRVGGVFMPFQATTVGAPAYVAGGMYYDTTLSKLRIGGVSAWETVTSA